MAKSKISGVYVFTCLPTEEQYVGSSKDIYSRKSSHVYDLKRGRHPNKLFQAAWDNFGGIEGFSFSILLICAETDLLFYEQRAIDVLEPALNISKLASGVGLSEEDLASRAAKIKIALARPDVKERHRRACKISASNPEVKAFKIANMTSVHADPGFKIRHREGLLKAHTRPEVKERQRAGMRDAWKKPETRERHKLAWLKRKAEEAA